MIEIFKPTISQKNGKSRCICELHINDDVKEIWFEVEPKYGKYLCIERADAYVIGILHYAMKNKHAIKCHVPITEELLYNIQTILIPSLAKYSKNLSEIEIISETAPGINSGTAVGTGCSCGIDSFSAIYNHINTKYKEYNLTHLCINNVGAYNTCYEEYGMTKVKDERYQATRKAAKEIGIDLIETDSNFSEIIKQDHLHTHTYSSIFAVYMLQKLWKKYFYASSGLDYSNFSIVSNDLYDCARYELLTLQCFSIEGLRIYSEGGEKSRIDKTADIVDYIDDNYSTEGWLDPVRSAISKSIAMPPMPIGRPYAIKRSLALIVAASADA